MTTTYPAVYDADDVDEMALGVLAALKTVRSRLGSYPVAVRIVDEYAAEIVAEFDEDGDDE